LEVMESKKIFLIVSTDPVLIEKVKVHINSYGKNVAIFTAADSAEALFKANNAFPHVAIIDVNLLKDNGFDIARLWLNRAQNPSVKESDHGISIILIADKAGEEHFAQEVETGQIQFTSTHELDVKLAKCIEKAMERVSKENLHYSVRTIKANEILFRMGDKANHVYIVKSGELVALINEVVLGKILAGEFVGEMAYINNDARSATVKAITDCELIEIPVEAIDTILFTKTAWVKALVATLAKRLKATIGRV
jgi:CRP/FNR family transcriptional regulator, cyclic AMP receptor protein